MPRRRINQWIVAYVVTAVGMYVGASIWAHFIVPFDDAPAAAAVEPADTGPIEATPAAPAPPHPIRVEGGAEFVARITDALDLLRQSDPAGYAIATANLKVIQEADRSGADVIDGEPGLVFARPTWSASRTWVASGIVHEAQHHVIRLAGRDWADPAAERECKEVQLATLTRIGAPKYEVEHLLAGLDVYHSDLDGDGDYDWDDYAKRDW